MGSRGSSLRAGATNPTAATSFDDNVRFDVERYDSTVGRVFSSSIALYENIDRADGGSL